MDLVNNTIGKTRVLEHIFKIRVDNWSDPVLLFSSSCRKICSARLVRIGKKPDIHVEESQTVLYSLCTTSGSEDFARNVFANKFALRTGVTTQLSSTFNAGIGVFVRVCYISSFDNSHHAFEPRGN